MLISLQYVYLGLFKNTTFKGRYKFQIRDEAATRASSSLAGSSTSSSLRIALIALLGLLFTSLQAQLLRDPQNKSWTPAAPDVYRVRVNTTSGDFVLEVTRTLAPRGADRFYHLVQAGFYDDSRFYRVIAGRFAQFGIAGDPVVAQTWKNQSFRDDPVRASNTRGTFAFAMTGPDARTTQIYINTSDQLQQDAQGFAPFGKVVEGMVVVDRLYSGYGERSGGGMRGGKQGRLFEEGNAYLNREFPKLDRLLKARVVARAQ